MTQITIIINDAPYGSERAYNGLRTGIALQKQEETKVNIFLMSDATFCGLENQTTPNGYYNIGRMVMSIAKKGSIGACGSCMDVRGISHLKLIEGTHRSSMDELSRWIMTSDKVITY